MVLCHSDKTSKHFDLKCLHNAKGTKHFGALTGLMRIRKFSFDT